MNRPNPNIRPTIHQLDETAINRIAAGEVVERPASAVKELVENALDAGARRISVDIADGGKTLIRVTDDGCGIRASELPLALARHATSKIDGSDLLNIGTFGFRGEALPSLGAVGRLKITSRVPGDPAAEISVIAGEMSAVKPAALNNGTVVELRDLFFATPARLKFMRTDRAESQAIADVVKRLAMAEPYVSFELRDVSVKHRTMFTYRAQIGEPIQSFRARLGDVIGKEFVENAIAIDAEREGLHLTGFAGLPTYSRGAAVTQFLFVNGRPVRDKLMVGALRAAYSDFLSRDRHPAAALFIDCNPELVDVNVHPAKSEVRFRDPGVARGLIVSGLRHALAEAGHRASSTVGQATLSVMAPAQGSAASYQRPVNNRASTHSRPETHPQAFAFSDLKDVYSATVPEAQDVPETADLPLGVARGQVHENYIIAQTSTGLVIVDQHAAHERLVYEKLKTQMAERGIVGQALLIPEIVTLSENDRQILIENAAQLRSVGLAVEPFGGGSIAVRETPAILGDVDAKALILDVLDELHDTGSSLIVQSKIEAVLSRIACHGSVRSGRHMRAEEMNALLRQMEATPHSGQCNHGRPTYVELKLTDIERLFGRT